MEASLTPIGQAINDAGITELQRAEGIARSGATTTFLSLAVALIGALLIGAWTGGKLLRPIRELRRGMSRVAKGTFSTKLPIPLDRPDEIGDLARSFTVMSRELAVLDRLKAEFVSVASHELKTPLSVIRGYVSLLRDGVYGPVSADQQKVLGSVGDQTDRLGRLIQQLLDISRFEAGVGRLEVHPIDLRAFLDELAVSFEALAAQNEIDFAVIVDESLPATIEGDADRLNEVVGNLLVNAFKFTPRHGRITLRAFPGPDADGGVSIEVADTGVGVPADQLPRVFEKFYQVENDVVPKSIGTGLGLAIAKELTEAHGGKISAESWLGRGTTFRMELPPRPPDAPGGEPSSS
jgi:signal transduction histidine kinase